MTNDNFWRRGPLAVFAVSSVLGCGEPSASEAGEQGEGEGESESAELEPTYTYWADAKAVLDSKCASCHTEGDIAPFSLDDYAEVAAAAAVLPYAIEAGTMPPWPPGPGCNEYRHARSLDADERELLLTWLAEGAPEGDPADEPPASEDPAPTFEPDVTISLPEPYTPTKEPDDYRCFPVAWDGPQPWVTGFRVLPDQRSVVHHVIAFAADPDQAEEVAQLDAADDGPGYTCYGSSGLPGARWIASWAPGGRGQAFPEGTGVRLEPGSTLIIQVHYNTSTSDPVADQSAVELSLADSVERPLVNQPLTNFEWVVGSEPMLIPAGEPEVTHATQIDVFSPLWSTPLAETGVAEGDDLLLHFAGLHMHQLGVRAKLTIVRADGGDTCVVEIPRWDFSWQGAFELREPLRVHPGDKIGLECTWDNSVNNQPIFDGELVEPQDVLWGEGTRDEMCLAVAAFSRP
ncbi:hypothetical protein ENSA5_56550 [Enhygromyxa salina]|uniref:Copper type II ascorbate-dependent monooxygenase C-terminal domain-containing protein n=1 Tax=Enhygromyxa salina TaxID=215803 RepID=A0A2S9XEK9_9BACT|nr:monooxygenase [Enhygromyxa salina]PRP91306.1 hypothetical protein ENSA5_56550 [Enhygromyxa salina]